MQLNSELPLFDRGVSMLCWAYNEQELIDDFIQRAIQLLESSVSDYEIVIIDDCSTDETNNIIRKWQSINSRIKLYRNSSNMDVGLSFQRAIQCANKEFLFWQTIDWSYDITELKFFLNTLLGCDVVAGVRSSPVQRVDQDHPLIVAFIQMFLNKNHITKRSDSIYQAVISIINYIVIRTLFKVPVSDYQNVCFYRTKILQAMQFESQSSFSNPEHLIKSFWGGYSIVEVPISFIPRQKGQSKGANLKSIYRSIKDILKLWIRWVIQNKRILVKKEK